MEVALGRVATGALNSVLEKRGTLLVDEYNHLKGVCGEIKFLTDELTAMHAFLLKMSEEEDPGPDHRFRRPWGKTSTRGPFCLEGSKYFLFEKQSKYLVHSIDDDLWTLKLRVQFIYWVNYTMIVMKQCNSTLTCFP